MSLKYEAACGSVIGKIRSRNEDNFYFDGHVLDDYPEQEAREVLPPLFQTAMDGVHLYAVFDGMGGLDNGQAASATAAASLKEDAERIKETLMLSETFFTHSVSHMNARVNSIAKSLKQNMGTTIAAVGFLEGSIYVCNVGDTRVYRLRDRKLTQISMDHIAKVPPFLEGKRHSKPGLTQCIGISQDELLLEPYIVEGETHPDDVYLLCSDGLTDMVSDEEILKLIHEDEQVDNSVQSLIDRAMERGGRDNTTLILVKIQKVF